MAVSVCVTAMSLSSLIKPNAAQKCLYMNNSMAQLGPLLMDLEGLVLTDEERELITHPSVGGLILFARNFESLEQLALLVQSIRTVRPQLLIAVDQEGGRVQRFKEGFTRLPALAEFGRLYEQRPDLAVSLAKDTGWLLAAELIASGIDFSFAPVVDVDRGISQVIGDRSFGEDSDMVIELASHMMAGMQEAGMATTLKHFPGHGGVEADSHVAMPVDERSYTEIASDDLKPFAHLVKLSQAVMPAHVIYSQCDSKPAGFSSFWLQEELRSKLQFDGVVFSDDLTMEAASVAGGFAQRVEQALLAGCTMVLVCNHREGVKESLAWLKTQGRNSCAPASKMKATVSHHWTDLKNDIRWQETRHKIQQLCAEQRR